MLPAPRRTVSQPAVPQSSWPDIDDDDGWQDMPVVRSEENALGLDEDDQKRYHYRPPVRLDSADDDADLGVGASSNATGAHLAVEADTLASDSWRQKNDQDESDYTRLRLDEDEESDAVHMRTKYLFNEDKAMTPLSQMQATKELLTEGQRIAYVGLCHLVARRMVRDTGRGWEGTKIKQRLLQQVKGKGKEKAELPVVESAGIWMIKIMARLYQHMELELAEQKMIESLAEHGVDPSDLVPALMATHTVKNPEFDPVAKKQADLGVLPEQNEEDDNGGEQLPAYEPRRAVLPEPSSSFTAMPPENVPLPPSSTPAPAPIFSPPASAIPERHRPINPFGDDDGDDDDPFPFGSNAQSSASSSRPTPRPPPVRLSSYDEEDDEGDIGRVTSPVKSPGLASTGVAAIQAVGGDDTHAGGADREGLAGEVNGDIRETRDTAATPDAENVRLDPSRASPETASPEDNPDQPGKPEALPSLPGVSTTLTNLDEHVTLDIRWTVLCDLFLVLIADSVYDARSRAFLEHIAEALGFEWLDVVRFENRVTDALEIQEAVQRSDQAEVVEGRRKGAQRKRYAMMGMAAVGGGLVIGLSAGLLAPVIGAGLGAAFATVGITGTTGFLAGAGGAAVITTGGVLTGANIAGQGMARRTRDVRTFEFRPLHNNKRVCCYITMGGFMASKVDDVRLPFSVLDSIVGDVLSVNWEPEMMAETGSALKILTSEVLTQVGQQVLAATVMTALMSALQWPMILTKLGYLIDNPWNNALDRSRAAGLVLADVILQRNAGVRPVSLIGFSLGSRAIFYALVELARHRAYGLVQDVFLFGTTVTASRVTWLEARSVVAGRFVNGFATNDWMLGYLFRATSGGINTVAGLRPVEAIPGLENVDVTDVIQGHMSYRSMMPKLLAKAGLPVTADHFDEPADPEVDMNVQERTVVNEAEVEAKKSQTKVLGLFPRSARSKPSSGSTTPTSDRPGEDRRSSSAGKAEYDEGDEDDLPPREGSFGAGVGAQTGGMISKEPIATVEDEAVKAIPKTAGFDFRAISKQLGKDIDVDKLELREPAPVPLVLREAAQGREAERRLGIDRSESAPPPSVTVLPPEEAARSSDRRDADMGRSASQDYTSAAGARRAELEDDEEDDAQDTARTAMRDMDLRDDTDAPSWDRPSPVRSASTGPAVPQISPPATATAAPYNFTDAWAQPSSASTQSYRYTGSSSMGGGSTVPRPAPPARPHPAEFMANPFANGSSADEPKKSPGAGAGGGSMWSWGKKQKSLEEEVSKNPW